MKNKCWTQNRISKTIWKLTTFNLLFLAIALIPAANVSAEIIIYENYVGGYALSTNTNSWNTYGDLLELETGHNQISGLQFRMFASDPGTEGNLSFFMYENNNDTVGNQLWSSGAINTVRATRGVFDVSFTGLSINAPSEVFMGIAIENYEYTTNGKYLSPIFGGENPTVGSSNPSTAVFTGAQGEMGLPFGLDLEQGGGEGEFQSNFHFRVFSSIPEPSSISLFGLLTVGCMTRRRRS